MGAEFVFVGRVASMCAHVCSIESTARADKKQLHKQTIAFSFTFDAMNAAHTMQIPPRRSGSARLTRRLFSRSRFCASSTSRASPPRAALSRRYPPRRASDQLRKGLRNAATRPFLVGGAKPRPPPRAERRRRRAAFSSAPPIPWSAKESAVAADSSPSRPTRRRRNLRRDGVDDTPAMRSVDPGTGTRRVAAPIRVPRHRRSSRSRSRFFRARTPTPRSAARAAESRESTPSARRGVDSADSSLVLRLAGLILGAAAARNSPAAAAVASAAARRRPRARLPPALPTRPPR